MSLDIHAVGEQPVRVQETRAERVVLPVPDSSSLEKENAEKDAKPADIGSTMSELQQVSLAFNRRLQFSVNSRLNEVVVKVIDKETDSVIKEIPARELQVVRERIREALGILFDERI